MQACKYAPTCFKTINIHRVGACIVNETSGHPLRINPMLLLIHSPVVDAEKKPLSIAVGKGVSLCNVRIDRLQHQVRGVLAHIAASASDGSDKL